ncbi:MAG: hypothetical protein P8Z76_16880 [Alphaproteobacteria bacterium]
MRASAADEVLDEIIGGRVVGEVMGEETGRLVAVGGAGAARRLRASKVESPR